MAAGNTDLSGGAHLDGPGRDDDPAHQEAQIRESLTTAFGVLGFDQDGMFQVAVDQFVALVINAAQVHIRWIFRQDYWNPNR